ncbi:MAG TPA: glycosyltransferase family 4 protein [Candidatus Limnocylindrales bacterium]|nr:glycosyltransferase family 4 protein [Candidatus Limnocylindrales bacterium]
MKDSLRVLVVTNLWPVGDSFRGIYVKEQVEALRRLGHHVDVEVVAQERGKADYFLAVQRVRRIARAGRYDVVHIHYGLAAFSARFLQGVPKVLSLYGSDINVGWQRLMTRAGMRGVGACVYVSENLAVNAGDERGHIIPDGVDFTLFVPGDRDAARKALGIAEDEKVILFGGHPDNWVKGYDVFSDVLQDLRERGIKVREIALAQPRTPRPEVPRKFDAADVLLFTSRKGSEGSPSVIKEATAMGLPVVSVNVGDAVKLLDGVVDFPEPWGTDEARAKLIRLLADRVADTLAAGTRSNSRERNRWLDAEQVARQVVEVYRQVLSDV